MIVFINNDEFELDEYKKYVNYQIDKCTYQIICYINYTYENCEKIPSYINKINIIKIIIDNKCYKINPSIISILEQNSGGFLKFELVYNYKVEINDISLIRKYKIKKLIK